ncbi:Endonuclease IV [Spironucleus salmonicida]|uniref:Apurinic/apyrimidinic endonuclease n=1 Tax=Spironucleus salmonicida TaxID=348837 RepID=V6LMB0_9EUKA|nr:Endonuclease IV [Spironucleus salmonicida]|eukprot:EST45770.1 Apurinic/apyrimidinic endonuclease [Spironucleus salmonicida]
MSEQDVQFITAYDIAKYSDLLDFKEGIYIGAHLSLSNLFKEMRDLKAESAAFFTTTPQSWNVKIQSDKYQLFYDQALQLKFYRNQFLPHGPYLLNLASEQERVREASFRRLVFEMFVVRSMGLDLLNIHPGTGSNIECVWDLINEAHKIVPDVIVVLETMAGNKVRSCVGSSFEQIKNIIDHISDQNRIGVCIDTQHTFAGGYANKDNFSVELIQNFDRLIGRSYLKGFHINDSLTEYNSKVDRHAPLQQGKHQKNEFKNLFSQRINSVYCLETTKPENWPQEIQLLKSYLTQ